MSEAIRRLLWWIIGGTKGGITRARIIVALKKRPMNANQLADLIELDYKTIRYHLSLLTKNKLLVAVGKKYGLVYFLSAELESNFKVFQEIWEKIKKEKQYHKV